MGFGFLVEIIERFATLKMNTAELGGNRRRDGGDAVVGPR